MLFVNCAEYDYLSSPPGFRVQVSQDCKGYDLVLVIGVTRPKHFQHKKLRLYLARNANGEWLQNDQNLSRFLSKEVDTQYSLLPLGIPLSDVFRDLVWDEKQVHILLREVEPPTSFLQHEQALLEEVLETSREVTHLPKHGEFLRLFDWSDADCGTFKDMTEVQAVMGDFIPARLYVCQEMLCTLKNVKDTYAGDLDGGFRVSRFIIIGSLSTGKSCLVALICMYLAAKHSRPIVWRGRTPHGPVIRLFYQKIVYEWNDRTGREYTLVVDGTKVVVPWFFLNGMTEESIKRNQGIDSYTVLATSSPFLGYSDEAMVRCVLPFWQKSDLDSVGSYLNLSTNEIDERYFVSGGSLWAFLSDQGRSVIRAEAIKFGHPHFEAFSCGFGIYESDFDDDSPRPGSRHDSDVNTVLRMYSVDDINDTTAYVTSNRWKRCVTSRFAMQCLAKLGSPEHVSRLMPLIASTDDSLTQDLVFVYQFHETVFRDRVLRVHRQRYASIEAEPFQMVWNNATTKNKLTRIED
ncbi:hypothetical protein Poli38472_005907 [Pythium oligandrum]|uniref:Crinkler (CRN) family protein n=1 Tax=Pythium oligandrum TaxID=41045 RepID=A0A8K1CRW0_PYTOL|nr:hypothetical protein Poli38472_005907 [Pythium oligandrum]|eukprot:TMW68439.1 hypothetical protein Poli38472_005907 [Pythium oligandrum]